MKEFRIAPEYVAQQIRRAQWLAAFLIMSAAGGIFLLSREETLSAMLVPAIGICFLGKMAHTAWKRSREGEDAYPVITLNEETREAIVSHQDMRVSVDLNGIRNLRLQYKKDRLKSILLKTASDRQLRFEGYRDIESLAETLKRLTPAQNIDRAKVYHQ